LGNGDDTKLRRLWRRLGEYQRARASRPQKNRWPRDGQDGQHADQAPRKKERQDGAAPDPVGVRDQVAYLEGAVRVKRLRPLEEKPKQPREHGRTHRVEQGRAGGERASEQPGQDAVGERVEGEVRRRKRGGTGHERAHRDHGHPNAD